MFGFKHPPKILNWFFPSFLWRVSTKKKELYLTFDDGPSPHSTKWIIEKLNEYKAKGTFFCTGEKVNLFSNDFKEIINNGHLVGNHTNDHINGWTSTKNEYIQNIEKCNKVIKSKIFRPPYGKIHPLSISEIKNKYKIIMWDVMSYDFKLEKEACYKEIIKKTKKGSIIVFHENSKSFDKLKYVLPKILKYYSEKGYRFNTIPVN